MVEEARIIQDKDRLREYISRRFGKPVAWITAKRFALEWIDANKPKHWARPMFAD